MALKDIVIKDCKLQNLSTSQSKLDIVVYPIDENGDLEPGASLKVYINDNLMEIFTSNDFGELKESILVNNVGDEIKVQIRDVSENIRSKIKIILKDNSNQSTANSATKDSVHQFTKTKQKEITLEEEIQRKEQEKLQKEREEFGKEKQRQIDEQKKQETIAKLKVNPNNIVHLNESQKNDIDIVKYALMQDGSLIQYVGNDVKNNKEIAKIVIKQGKHNFHYISDLLKTNIDFILELLNEFGDNFGLSGYVRNEPRIQNRLSIFSENKNKLIIIKNKYFSDLHLLNNNNDNLKKEIQNLESTIFYKEKKINNDVNKLNKKDDFFVLFDSIVNLYNILHSQSGENLAISSQWMIQRSNFKHFLSSNQLRGIVIPFQYHCDLENRKISEGLWNELSLNINKEKNELNNLRNKLSESNLRLEAGLQGADLKTKREELISLYKNLKKQYPFFVDKEIEKML